MSSFGVTWCQGLSSWVLSTAAYLLTARGQPGRSTVWETKVISFFPSLCLARIETRFLERSMHLTKGVGGCWERRQSCLLVFNKASLFTWDHLMCLIYIERKQFQSLFNLDTSTFLDRSYFTLKCNIFLNVDLTYPHKNVPHITSLACLPLYCTSPLILIIWNNLNSAWNPTVMHHSTCL